MLVFALKACIEFMPTAKFRLQTRSISRSLPSVTMVFFESCLYFHLFTYLEFIFIFVFEIILFCNLFFISSSLISLCYVLVHKHFVFIWVVLLCELLFFCFFFLTDDLVTFDVFSFFCVCVLLAAVFLHLLGFSCAIYKSRGQISINTRQISFKVMCRIDGLVLPFTFVSDV